MKNSVTSLSVKNFTVFQDEQFEFAPHLNVVIGENGTGKSHLLKLVYSLLAVSNEAGKMAAVPGKGTWQTEIAGKLTRVFRPDALGRLKKFLSSKLTITLLLFPLLKTKKKFF